VELLYEDLRTAWWALVPDPTLRQLAITAVMFGAYYLVVAFAERLSHSRNERIYRSPGFFQDVAYYFFWKGGGRILLPTAIVLSLEQPLGFLHLHLIDGLPLPVRIVCWLLASDFVGYWVHRARHHYPFLWAFHTTHHSQTDLTFATYTRVHPVEDFTGMFVGLFLALVVGISPITGAVAWLLLDFLGETSHSRVSWTFGPLRWILVTPRFHSFHHSADPAHHDRNFGVLFSFWDRIFGTAVDEKSAMPTSFGLADVKPTSLWRTIVSPFELLVQYYGPRSTLVPDPLSDSTPEAR